MLAMQQMSASKSLTTQMRSSAVITFLPNSTMYGCNKMTDELELIERLCRLRCVLYTKPDLADAILVRMIEEAEEKVHAFEHEFELEMDDGA